MKNKIRKLEQMAGRWDSEMAFPTDPDVSLDSLRLTSERDRIMREILDDMKKDIAQRMTWKPNPYQQAQMRQQAQYQTVPNIGQGIGVIESLRIQAGKPPQAIPAPQGAYGTIQISGIGTVPFPISPIKNNEDKKMSTKLMSISEAQKYLRRGMIVLTNGDCGKTSSIGRGGTIIEIDSTGFKIRTDENFRKCNISCFDCINRMPFASVENWTVYWDSMGFQRDFRKGIDEFYFNLGASGHR